MGPEEWWRSHAWTDQRTQALAIVARGDQIRSIARTTYSVRSQSHPEQAHTVTESGAKWSCGCDFFRATGMVCVHILAVRYKVGFEDTAPAPATPKVVCDACQSAEVVLQGIRHNKSGDIQRYVCKSCGRRFRRARRFPEAANRPYEHRAESRPLLPRNVD